jgi:hypothetical protein
MIRKFLSVFIVPLFSFLTSLQALDVCFVTIHPISAEHFARFTEELEKAKISWQILAADSSETFLKQKKIPHRKISVWTNKKMMKELSHEDMRAIAKLAAKECKKAKLVITDVSEPFVVYLHQQLAVISSAKRYVYYDNSESYVPGEYSKCFEQLLRANPHGVLFANKLLVDQTLFGEEKHPLGSSDIHKVGLGFYPLEDVMVIESLIKQKEVLREKLFSKLGIKDEKQKVLAYLGGANSVYFDQAFPFFLKALEENRTDPFFENILLLLQQHPRAKQEGTDLYLLFSQGLPFQVFASPLSTFEVIACSDLMYYYQTSLVPKLLLARRPLVQVAEEVSEDVGVKLHLVDVVTSPKELPVFSSRALSKSLEDTALSSLKEAVGYDKQWKDTLLNFIKNPL